MIRVPHITNRQSCLASPSPSVCIIFVILFFPGVLAKVRGACLVGVLLGCSRGFAVVVVSLGRRHSLLAHSFSPVRPARLASFLVRGVCCEVVLFGRRSLPAVRLPSFAGGLARFGCVVWPLSFSLPANPFLRMFHISPHPLCGVLVFLGHLRSRPPRPALRSFSRHTHIDVSSLSG